MPNLLSALSFIRADGVEVALMQAPARTVTTASGLAGIASREVVVARSGRNGSRNLTRYRDDQAIVITGILGSGDANDTWAQYDVVAGALSDAVDTDRLLKWTAGNGLMLQRNVRLSSLDGPLDVGPDIVTYQATFRASDPNAYSQTLYTASAVPLGSTGGGGFVFPFTFPFHFNAPVSATAAFTNSGFLPTPPTFTLQGYLHNPVVQLTADIALVVNGDIAATDTLVIDVDERTVLLNGVANRRPMLDTTRSTWFYLPRGSGMITLVAEDWSPGANVTVAWRDART